MDRQEAKEMWPIMKAFAEGHEIKFCGESHPNPSFVWEAVKAANYEIVPKKKPIDLSVLIESAIDCEFADSVDFSFKHIGVLDGISNTNWHSIAGGTCYRYCRPRMNHIHFWGGGQCPLPDGLKIEVYAHEWSGPVIGAPSDFIWTHDDIAKIVGFKVLGLWSESERWPWQVESDK